MKQQSVILLSLAMSKVLSKAKFIILLTLFFGSVSYAQNFDKSDVPPLTPLRLFVDKLNPEFSVMLARPADLSQGYFLIINDGKNVYSPMPAPNSMIYYDGGTADFYLQSGERVLLPTKKHYNQIDTTLGPTVIYPNKVPTYLEEIEVISDELISKYGFESFLSPKETALTVIPQTQAEDPPHLSNVESKVIMLIQVLNENTAKLAEKKLREALGKLDPQKARILEHAPTELTGRYQVVLLVDPDMVSEVIESVPSNIKAALSVFDPTEKQEKNLKVDLDGFKLLTSLFDEGSYTLQQLSKVIGILNYNSEYLAALDEEEKDDLVYLLADILGDLEQIHAYIQKLAMVETAIDDYNSGKTDAEFLLESVYNARRSETHPLKKAMLDPLRETAKELFQLLDHMDYNVASTFLVETASAVQGAGFPLLQGKPFGKDHSYFVEWLNQRRLYHTLIDDLPLPADFKTLPEMDLKLFYASNPRLYGYLGVMGSLLSLKNGKTDPVSYYWAYNEKTERLPTFLLGMPGDTESLKRDLIQYIIDADKKSQA